jgi:TRAP-type C4-dicarboxylate transport system substrate-binding protein
VPKGVIGLGMYAADGTGYVFRAPVTTTNEFTGKKIRVFGSPLEIEVVRRLGGTAIPMPLSEVLPSLQQNGIDGVKAGLSMFVPLKFVDVAKYVVQTDETIVCPIMLMSKVWYDKQADDVRKIIAEEALAANKANIEATIAIDAANQKAWVDQGGTLSRIPPAEEAAYRARMAVVGDEFMKDRPGEREMYAMIKRVAARVR